MYYDLMYYAVSRFENLITSRGSIIIVVIMIRSSHNFIFKKLFYSYFMVLD